MYREELIIAPMRGDSTYTAIIAVNVHATEPHAALPEGKVISVNSRIVCTSFDKVAIGLSELKGPQEADSPVILHWLAEPLGLDNRVRE